MRSRLALIGAVALLAAALTPQVVSATTAAPASTGAVAQTAGCADPVVDDFSTGADRIDIRDNDTRDKKQTGQMIGGQRFTRFIVADTVNPYELPSTLTINPAGDPVLVVASGYLGSTGLQMFYGLKSAGVAAPLHADLSCYDRFRVHFAYADNGLNFNMQLRSTSSTAPYQCGQNTPPGLTNGFVAEFPFSCFVTNDPAHPPVDLAHIDLIDLLIGGVGGSDYAITEIELASTGCDQPICSA